MGLDVYLYQFRNVDTDSILKLSSFSDKLGSCENVSKAKAKLKAKARQLGLPEEIAIDPCCGGAKVSVISKRFSSWDIGTWAGLDVILAITSHFLSKDVYFIFPEAEGDPQFFRPDWCAAKVRLSEILQELKKLKPAQLESFIPSYWELFENDLKEIEIVIETIDYVLSQSDSKQFLLCWSI